MAVEQQVLNHGATEEQTAYYDSLLRRALYHMKLQNSTDMGFRLYLKGLYPLLNIRSAAEFNTLVDGEVSDDYFSLADKKSKANEHPVARTLKIICLAVE